MVSGALEQLCAQAARHYRMRDEAMRLARIAVDVGDRRGASILVLVARAANRQVLALYREPRLRDACRALVLSEERRRGS